MTNLERKLIILYIKDYFEKCQYMEVKTADLMMYLELKGLALGRKTLIHNIKVLKMYGMDIRTVYGKGGAYFFQGYKEVNNND